MSCEHGLSPWWDCDTCRSTSRFAMDAFEPRYDEHLSEEDLTYTSSRERTKYMDSHGIVEKKNPYESKIARGATGKALFLDMGK